MALSSKLTFLTLLTLLSCAQEKGHAPGEKDCSDGGSCIIFITDDVYTGNFGGIEEADEFCNSDKNKPNGSDYKAILANNERRACTTADCESDGIKENLDWVLYPEREYVLRNGEVIGTTSSAAIFKKVSASVSDGEYVQVWTGFDSSWVNNDDCSNWTSTTGQGGYADFQSVSEFGQSGHNACSNASNLVCAEQ